MTIEEPQSGGLNVRICPMFGGETLHMGNQVFDDGSAHVLAFWQWALGDLRANLTVGVLAEWIVARLLYLPLETRPTYSEYDLKTAGGKRIEVKATSYLQGWEQMRPSIPSFRITRTLLWTPLAHFAKKREFHADWYVCCLESCKTPAEWDPLDLDEWRFFLLSRAQVEKFDLNQKTIGVTTLRKKRITELTALELRTQGLKCIESEVQPTAHTTP